MISFKYLERITKKIRFTYEEHRNLRLLNKYFRLLPKFFDLGKKHILDDKIDIKKWETNVIFLLSDLRGRSSFLKVYTSQEQQLIRDTTSLVRKIKENLRFPVDYPLFLDIRTYFWFIAAYPDVIDYFYPSINYDAKNYSFEKERIATRKRRAISDKHFYIVEEQFVGKYADKGEPIHYFLFMKEYYCKEINPNLLLAKTK